MAPAQPHTTGLAVYPALLYLQGHFYKSYLSHFLEIFDEIFPGTF